MINERDLYREYCISIFTFEETVLDEFTMHERTFSSIDETLLTIAKPLGKNVRIGQRPIGERRNEVDGHIDQVGIAQVPIQTLDEVVDLAGWQHRYEHIALVLHRDYACLAKVLHHGFWLVQVGLVET